MSHAQNTNQSLNGRQEQGFNSSSRRNKTRSGNNTMGSQGANQLYQKRQSKGRGTGASTNHSQFVNQLEDA